MEVVYTAKATSTGGREGGSATDDGRLKVQLSTPKELGGAGGPGTNPEQLFAAPEYQDHEQWCSCRFRKVDVVRPLWWDTASYHGPFRRRFVLESVGELIDAAM